jgi:hypothetical protein
MKQLSFEGRFESGMNAIVEGKVWAFCPTPAEGDRPMYGLGIALANEQGYYPIPLAWVWGDTWAEMSAHAESLNAEEGLSRLDAAKIVISTMRAMPSRRRAG